MEDTIFDFTKADPAITTSNLQWLIVIVVVVILVLLFVGVIISLRRLFTRPDLFGMSRDQIKARWNEIEDLTEQGQLAQKMAIVEADKLLDGALKSLAMPGTTLGERLKVASYKYPELKHVWVAHKLRNQLVHESSFEMSKSQAKHAIQEFKKALKVLNVL